MLAIAGLALAHPGVAALSERDLAAVAARPSADARLPGQVPFADIAGRRTTLAAVAGDRPLVLVFADYTCRHVCSPGLALTGGALHDTGLIPGRDFRLAVIGIDPRDTMADARHLARSLNTAPDVARATTLLTGDPPSIAAATHALGYGYAFDRENDQFAHDAVLYVFAPDGRLAAVLPELGLRPEALAAALTTGRPAPQGIIEQVAHLCYGFAAAHGRFGRPIVLGLQLLSLLLIAGAAWLLYRYRRSVR